MHQLQKFNAHLMQNAAKATLPQAVRMVVYYLKVRYPHEDYEKLYNKIRFKANPSLAFQKSELSKVQVIENGEDVCVELTLNFLSIFGSSSPLPSHYSETVLKDLDSNEVLKDYLNIFNHHLQKLIFPIWIKHRYYMQYQSDLKDNFSKYMLSFIGLIEEHKNKKSLLNLHKLLPYLGTLSMRVKSTGMLVSILRHYLSHQEIEINQCEIDTVAIPSWQYCALGVKNTTLNSDTCIGKFVKCRSTKFSILLKNALWNYLYEFSIYGKKMLELKELIEFMLKQPLHYDLKLQVPKKEVQMCQLTAQNSAYLGVNTVIGNSEQNLNVTFMC